MVGLQGKKGRHCRKLPLAILLAAVLLCSGCENRGEVAVSKEVPKEIQVSAPVSGKGEDAASNPVLPEDEQLGIVPGEAVGAKVEEAVKTAKKIKAKIVTADEQRSWDTSDDMLSDMAYSLIHLKNEVFKEKLDLRPCDYTAVFIDAEGKEESYSLWVNFERENEVIVEDSESNFWNLSIEDSNAMRAMLNDLK